MSNKMSIEDGVNISGLLVGGMTIMGPQETVRMVDEYIKMYDLDKDEVEGMFNSAKDKLKTFMDTIELEDENETEDDDSDDNLLVP